MRYQYRIAKLNSGLFIVQGKLDNSSWVKQSDYLFTSREAAEIFISIEVSRLEDTLEVLEDSYVIVETK